VQRVAAQLAGLAVRCGTYLDAIPALRQAVLCGIYVSVGSGEIPGFFAYSSVL